MKETDMWFEKILASELTLYCEKCCDAPHYQIDGKWRCACCGSTYSGEINDAISIQLDRVVGRMGEYEIN